MWEREKREDQEREQTEDRDREKGDKRELSFNNLKRRIRNIDTCPCLFSASSRHCVSPEFPTRFCSKALQQSSISLQQSGLVKGLAR